MKDEMRQAQHSSLNRDFRELGFYQQPGIRFGKSKSFSFWALKFRPSITNACCTDFKDFSFTRLMNVIILYQFTNTNRIILQLHSKFLFYFS